MIWKEKNLSRETIKLTWADGSPFLIEPGDRKVFPRQVEFLEDMYKYDAVFYGGSMASGKTYVLLWACVYHLMKLWQEQGLTRQRVVVFSSTYSASYDRHLSVLHKYFPEWLGNLRMKPLPEFIMDDDYGGGVICFRNLQDVEQYKSSEFVMIAIDELTEISDEQQFDFLLLRKHRKMSNVPVIAASNPTGPGRAWVAKRFGCINPNTGQKSEEKMINGKVHRSRGYKFIKALPSDNPTLSAEALFELMSKPEKERRAYFEGDWTVFEGQFFSLDPQVHIFDRNRYIPFEWDRYRAIDKGYSHPTVCLWGAVDYDGCLWVYREYSASGGYQEKHKKEIAALSVYDDQFKETYRASVGDPSMWSGDRSAAGNKTPAEIFNDKNDGIGTFNLIKARNTDRPGRWMALINALGYEYEIEVVDGVQRKKVIREPRIRIASSCTNLISSIQNAQYNPKKPDDIIKSGGRYDAGMGDDELETLGYLWLHVTRARPDPNERVAPKHEPDRDASRGELADRYPSELYKNTWAN